MTEIFPLSLWSTTPQPSKIWTHHHGYALPVYQTTYSTRVIRQNSRWSVRKRSVIWPSRTVHQSTYLYCNDHDMAAATPFQPRITIRLLLYSIRRPHQYTILPLDIHHHMISEDTLVWHCTPIVIMQQSNRWGVLGWRVQNIQQYTREIYQI